jgi:hypothetical protein
MYHEMNNDKLYADVLTYAIYQILDRYLLYRCFVLSSDQDKKHNTIRTAASLKQIHTND